MSNTAQKPKAKGMDRFFDFIERTGNKLPTPFMLFVYLTIATAVLSAILSYMGVSEIYMAAGKDGVLAETTVAVKNLFSSDVLYATMKGFVSNYVSFAPLGIIIVMMFGIALIDYTGLVRTLVKKTLLGAPTALITFALAFVAPMPVSRPMLVGCWRWSWEVRSSAPSAAIRWLVSSLAMRDLLVGSAPICWSPDLTPCWLVSPRVWRRELVSRMKGSIL